jgi:predicted outer membrane repeat protein
MKRVFLTAVISLLVSKVFCAELLVPIQYPTIQSAIDAAATGDTVIVSPGIYTGVGNKDISFSGKAITVRSVDPNDPCIVENTVIDCNGAGRGFYLDANSAVEGFTITGGNTDSGGAIRVESSSPLIRKCNIISNHATMFGGGIYCAGSSTTVTITDCNISNNIAFHLGGAISATGTINVVNCTLVGNQASTGGGGIYINLSSVLNMNNSVLVGNFSQTNGGGLYVRRGGSSVITNWCTISGNAANNLGGGIYLESLSALSAINTIFWGNSDSSGTGLSSQITPTYSITSMLFSCIQDAGSYIVPPFDINDNGIICDDPLFVRMPSDGGDGWGVGGNDDYGDLHLLPVSPCIDAGSPLYVPEPNITDIDGEQRAIGLASDMGADEYGKMIVVNKPVEGEVWATSSRHRIKWSKYGVNSVDVLLSTDDGVNWESIAGPIADNNYLWQIPDDIESNQCVISVLPADGDANVISWESGLFTVAWYPVQPAVPPEWQGFLPSPDLSENQGPRLGCVKWVFQTAGPVSSQIAVTWPYWNSYSVYIGCEDGLVYALNEDGELIWSYDINTPIVGSPAVGYYEMVYVAGQNGRLYAIDNEGVLRWTHTTAGPVFSTPVVDYDGKIYVCSEDGLIYALDADGSELWTFQTRGPANLNGAIFATPGIDSDGSVYIAGLYDPNLYALNAGYGSVIWVCTFASASDPNNANGGLLFAPPAIGHDGTIYQTLVNDPNLYAIDPGTGNINWATSLQQAPDLNSSGWSSPVVGPDGTIYVCVDVPYLWAVNPDGSIKWVTRLGMVGGFTLSADRDSFVYAASDDGFVCVVDSNGQEVSRFKGNDWVSFPAIAEDGTLIVSDVNNRVWAITSSPCEGQSPVLRWPADVQPSWSVDFTDFAMMANSWLECTDPGNESCGEDIFSFGVYSTGDLNRNYYVNFEDIALLVDKWLMGTRL